MAAQQLTITGAQGQPYPLYFGRQILGNQLLKLIGGKSFDKIAIITNEIVAPLYAELLMNQIENSCLIILPDGEKYKNQETLASIYNQLLENKITRNSLIIALGGGVIGDMAGYAAATYLRGIPLVQVPTTLLAMVDASIGGKVGINLPQGKNLIGAFTDPVAIIQDYDVLDTLLPKDYNAGIAEIIKSALIASPDLFNELETNGMKNIEEIITQTATIKISLVEVDRKEHGQRVLLNFGHTIGHTLEVTSGYSLSHGHAVAIGICAAMRLSAYNGELDVSLIPRTEHLLKTLGLPTRYSEPTYQDIREAMNFDKKINHGGLRFVLLTE
ncbi:MAG: 3-dehydroquinate synthase, partial [Chloroflexota bacterium]